MFMFAPTEAMNAAEDPSFDGGAKAGQFKYEIGFPTVTATTMTAIKRRESAPVEMRKGRAES